MMNAQTLHSQMPNKPFAKPFQDYEYPSQICTDTLLRSVNEDKWTLKKLEKLFARRKNRLSTLTPKGKG